MDASDNPYSILGIPETATAREIRTAYRRLALEHHPDRNPNDDSFAKINHAYEVLSKGTPKAKEGRNPHRSHYEYPTDPFSVFESVFRDDFHRDVFERRNNHLDPFASSFFRRSLFDDDPFFRRGSPSLHRNDMFGRMDDMFERMDDIFQQSATEGGTSDKSKAKTNGVQYFSSSTVSRRDSNGRWVTETTTNENGKKSKEYITRDAEGNILEQRCAVEQDTPRIETEASKKSFFRLPWRRDDEY